MTNMKELGHTLLETALVIPVALGIVLGAVDVNHALRTRAALKEGARTALRCLYTTDGVCTETANSDFIPLYDVYQTTVSENYVSPLYGFKGTIRYIEPPQFEATFEARVLDKGFATLKYYQHTIEQRRYPAVAPVKTNVLYALYPYVTGTSPENAKLVWRENRNRSYAPIVNQDISSISGAATNRNRTEVIGRSTFTVPSPYDQTLGTCNLSQNFNSSIKSEPDLTKMCSERKNYSSSSANIVIQVTGDVQGSTNGTTGAIRLFLEDDQGQTIRDLGGRELTPSPGQQDGSLVPRGVPEQYKSDSLDYWEVTGHSPISIKFDKKYRIRLEVEYRAGSRRGTFHWHGKRLKIFGPKASVADGGTLPCDYYLLPSEEGNILACKNSKIPGMGSPYINDWSTYKTDFSKTIQSSVSQANTSAILGELQINSDPKDISVATNGPFFIEKSFNCPAPGENSINTGVPENPNDGYIVKSESADEICPANYDQGKYELSALKWNEKLFALQSDSPVIWTRETCAETTIPNAQIPSIFKRYPKLKISNHPYGYASKLIHTGPGYDKEHDPRTIVKDDPSYNCKDMPLTFRAGERITPTQEQLKELPADSFFKNFHVSPIRCERQWKTLVTQEAVKELQLPENAFFQPDFTGPYGDGLLSQEADLNCYEWKSRPGVATDEIYLGRFSKTKLPEECKDDKHRCRFALTGFEGNAGSTTPIADFKKAAEVFAQREIQAINPRARFNCEDVDCVQIDISTDNEHFVAQTKAKVALNILGGAEFPLEYAERQRWESYLSK